MTPLKMTTVRKRQSFKSPAGLVPQVAALIWSCCKRLGAGLAVRDPDKNQLRLLGRLAVTHGGTVSVMEFQSDRFLVGTSSKGHMTLLAMPPRMTRQKKQETSICRGPGL
jgi:hypothetical protein